MLAIADSDFRQEVGRVLQPECATLCRCPAVKQAAGRARMEAVDVVILDMDGPGEQGALALRRLTADAPDRPVIVLSSKNSTEALREAMVLGARDYLTKPVAEDELKSAYHRAADRVADAPIGESSPHPVGISATDLPGLAKGIWSFCSATSGVGRTTFMISAAHELVRRGYTVATVDLDLFFGDLPFYYGFQRSWTGFAELFDSPDYLAPREIENALTRHRSGVQVLAGPLECTQASSIDRRLIAEVVLALESNFDYVLVDFPAGVSDVYLPVLDASQAVFLVANDDLSALKNLTAYLNLMKNLDFPWKRIHAVLVASSQRPEPQEDFNRILSRLGTEIAATLPGAGKLAYQAVLKGQPVTELQPEGAYAEAVRLLLSGLTGEEPEVPAQTTSILGRLLGWSRAPAQPGAVRQFGV
jgi:pilus assembly protein CpaE